MTNHSYSAYSWLLLVLMFSSFCGVLNELFNVVPIYKLIDNVLENDPFGVSQLKQCICAFFIFTCKRFTCFCIRTQIQPFSCIIFAGWTSLSVARGSQFRDVIPCHTYLGLNSQEVCHHLKAPLLTIHIKEQYSCFPPENYNRSVLVALSWHWII